MSAVVLTSENSDAFYAGKLGLSPPEPVVADDAKASNAAAVESGADAEGEATEPGADEQQNTTPDTQARHKLNLRFSELTKQRDDAKAAADAHAADLRAEREARALAEKRAQDAEAKLNPSKPADDDGVGPKPKQEDYTDAFKYAEDLAEWSTHKVLRERDQKEADDRTKAQLETKARAFRDGVAEVRKEVPDYDAILTASPVIVSKEVHDAIIDSEEGPRLLLHLAQNPDVAQKLAGMTVGQALRQIGKLEVTVARAATTPPDKGATTKPAAAAAEISRAPAPINPLRGSSSIPDTPLTANGEFTGTYAQWKELRKAGKIK